MNINTMNVNTYLANYIEGVERFPIEITPQHMEDGIPQGPSSCALAMAIRDAGYKDPVVDDYEREITFGTEDSRSWVAALTKPSTEFTAGKVNLEAVEWRRLRVKEGDGLA